MRCARLLPLLLVSLSLPALAQSTRTWVSGVGDDVNPCSRTAPCKTLAGAISKTAAGGEINALDPGGFGSVTITKAITIDLHNTLGSVLAPGTNGINVNAGVNDVVVLRGIDVQGAGTGLSGVKFLNGKALVHEDVTIAGFQNVGVEFVPPAGSTAQLFLHRVHINTSSNATAATSAAISIARGQATLERAVIDNCPVGLLVGDPLQAPPEPPSVTMTGATISGSSSAAVHVQVGALSLERSVIAGNGTGVLADTGATVRLSNTMLSHNTVGVSGDVTSFGNNRLSAGNGSTTAPTTTLPQQ